MIQQESGNPELEKKLANDIYEHCEQSSNKANEGSIVIAAYKNPLPKESGHVMAVVPGKVEQSGKWGGVLPMVMDTGENTRAACQKMSENLGPYKKHRTKFFTYQGPINR